MHKLVVAVACAGFAVPAVAELVEVELAPGAVIEKRLTVAPGKFAEVCSALKRGQAIAWQFRGDAAVDFNIHYHVGKKVEYPEQRKDVKDAAGSLAVALDQDYCWMWSNKSGSSIAVEVTLEAK